MIQLLGQYILKFDLPGYPDFLVDEDFHFLSVTEKAGGPLPLFSIACNIYDDNIIKTLNEGNILTFSYGKDIDGMITVPIRTKKNSVTSFGEDRRSVIVEGFLDAPNYITQGIMKIYGNQTSFSVIKSVASKYFTVISEGNSSDTQNWIQHNISDSHFIENLYKHSYHPKSFPVYGITMYGEFILYPYDVLISKEEKWRFVTKHEESKDIVYEGDIEVIDNSGIMNQIASYGRESYVYNIEDGIEELIKEDVKPMIAMNSSLHRSAEIVSRAGSNKYVNDNVNKYYHLAENKNRAHITAFSSASVELGFHGDFRPVRVLDLVLLKNDEIRTLKNLPIEYFTGLYVISKVVRNISNKQFTTTVTLCREVFNSLFGENR